MLSQMKWLRFATTVLLVLSLLCGSALAKKPPKDPPPDPDPEPLPTLEVTYVMIPLGKLGGTSSSPRGINDAGDVVGVFRNATGTYAFLWSESDGMVDLNDLIDPDDAWVLTYAGDINNVGQIAGEGLLNNERRLYRYTPPGIGEEFGIVKNLGTFGSGTSTASGINDHGDVTGYSPNDAGVFRGFLYTDDDGLIDITGDSWLDAGPTSINNARQIAGSGYVAGKPSNKRFAFLYAPGVGMTNLGALVTTNHWSQSSGEGINFFGEVVGATNTSKSTKLFQTTQGAFLYTETEGMIGLGTLPGDKNSSASGINDLGDIVGISTAADGTRHGFLLVPGYAMANLDDLVVPSGSHWLSPIGLEINNTGQIIAKNLDLAEAVIFQPVD